MTRPLACVESDRSATEFELHVGRGWLTSERALVKHINRNDANGYYKTLGLSPDATKEEIKAAYRKLAKVLHPDRGGDEELFRFVAEIARTLLDSESKSSYDSVSSDSIFLGAMEQEELARSGLLRKSDEAQELIAIRRKPHWACYTAVGFAPGDDTDAWITLCREVAPAVGYRGKIRVGVVEDGQNWPCDPSYPWGIISAGPHIFVVFQRGVEPNRLHALCAMIDWQNHLLNQIWGSTQDRERKTWP